MEIGLALRDLKADGTLECGECAMPMFAYERERDEIRLECANHHQGVARVPRAAAVDRLVDNWISKRGAQLHVQHERWGPDEEKGRDERDI